VGALKAEFYTNTKRRMVFLRNVIFANNAKLNKLGSVSSITPFYGQSTLGKKKEWCRFKKRSAIISPQNIQEMDRK
jgi:hypothetical protein